MEPKKTEVTFEDVGEMLAASRTPRQAKWLESLELVQEGEKMLEMLRQAVLGSEDGTIMGQAARQAWAAFRIMFIHLAPGSVLDTRPRDPLLKKYRNLRRANRALQKKLADLRYGVEHRTELEQIGAIHMKSEEFKNWARAANESHAATRAKMREAVEKLDAILENLPITHDPAAHAELRGELIDVRRVLRGK